MLPTLAQGPPHRHERVLDPVLSVDEGQLRRRRLRRALCRRRRREHPEQSLRRGKEDQGAGARVRGLRSDRMGSKHEGRLLNDG